MKTLLMTAAAAALIFAAPAAFARDDQHDQHDHPGWNGTHDTHTPPTHTTPTAPVAPDNHTPHGSWPAHTTTTHTYTHQDYTHHDMNTTFGGHDNHSRVGVHVTINFNRHNVSAAHHFHYRGGAYRWPGGYHYQRWSYGARLPTVFWGRDYWVDDYSAYGLAYPPDGAVWIRYGNDAILIDQSSGEILEVVYGQFY